MKKRLALIFALIGWFAIITQFILMVQNSETPITETTIRFFSFFTILTNTLVASYFTYIFLIKKVTSVHHPGVLTGITIYITLVGLVYQVALRHVWEPQGLQKLVDELLHSVIPVLVIIFWYLYETTKSIKYREIFNWAIFPLVYLFYILVRGSVSNFYPYPFVDVSKIGMSSVLINSVIILVLFIVLSTVFLIIGKSIIKR